MTPVQTLILNKKKFALLPLNRYEKMLAQLIELQIFKDTNKEYNKELAQAMNEIEEGDFYTHEQVKRKLNVK